MKKIKNDNIENKLPVVVEVKSNSSSNSENPTTDSFGDNVESEKTSSTKSIPRLVRSETDKIIGGVAGGIANYLEIDPILVRIAFLVLMFGAGSGFLIYIMLWIILPSENSVKVNSKDVINENLADVKNQAEKIVGEDSVSEKNGKYIIGGIVIFLGVASLMKMLGVNIDFNWLWPWVIIAFGIVIIVRK